MKNFDIKLLLIYIFGMGIISATTNAIFNASHLGPDWIWRSLFMGITGGTVLYIWDLTRSQKKK